MRRSVCVGFMRESYIIRTVRELARLWGGLSGPSRLPSFFRLPFKTGDGERRGSLKRDGDGWELRKKTGKSDVKRLRTSDDNFEHSYFAILIESLSVRGERNGRCQILVNSDWKFFCRMLSELTTVSQYCDSQRAYGNEKFWNGTETGRRRRR